MKIEELKKEKWVAETYKDFIGLLTSFADEKYGVFNSKIIPNLGKSYNVRMPILRKMVKAIIKNPDMNSFYNFVSAGDSYEEKLLQGMLLPKIDFKSSSEMFTSIDYYLLKINNWALCDSFVNNIKPLVLNNKDMFFEKVNYYAKSPNPWCIRFGLGLLNSYFCELENLDFIFSIIKDINTDNHYVNMAVAWLISCCYLTDKNKTKVFITSEYISDWCRNKSIQKIIASLKTSAEEKEDMKKLRKYRA